MAKNERNYIPKSGNMSAGQYNGTQTTAAAPMPIWQAGAEGGKCYAVRALLTDVVGGGGARNFDIYYSPDGVAFTRILRTQLTGGATATELLFTDFFITNFALDEAGNKYINFEADGGFFVDIADNTNTIDFESYGEDY